MLEIKYKIGKGEVIIYEAKDGPRIDVRLEQETVWLDAHQIAEVFDIDRTVVVKHIGNIYNTSELKEKPTCAKIAQVAADGKLRKMNIYNLDMIISVGYRVNSQKATQFRIWATKTLKNHLVRGYTINEKRLLKAQGNLKQLQESIAFLEEKSKHELLKGQTNEILSLLSSYSKSLSILEQYDKGKLTKKERGKAKFILEIDDCTRIIQNLKQELIAKKEASELFGQENSGRLEGIIKGLYQTFGGKEIYKSIEEKAAHILYLITKDHPFLDGNKRIASILFVYFLDRNNYLYKKTGERKINDNALAALALLIAISDPKEKETMINIVTNLIG